MKEVAYSTGRRCCLTESCDYSSPNNFINFDVPFALKQPYQISFVVLQCDVQFMLVFTWSIRRAEMMRHFLESARLQPVWRQTRGYTGWFQDFDRSIWGVNVSLVLDFAPRDVSLNVSNSHFLKNQHSSAKAYPTQPQITSSSSISWCFHLICSFNVILFCF